MASVQTNTRERLTQCMDSVLVLKLSKKNITNIPTLQQINKQNLIATWVLSRLKKEVSLPHPVCQNSDLYRSMFLFVEHYFNLN